MASGDPVDKRYGIRVARVMKDYTDSERSQARLGDTLCIDGKGFARGSKRASRETIDRLSVWK